MWCVLPSCSLPCYSPPFRPLSHPLPLPPTSSLHSHSLTSTLPLPPVAAPPPQVCLSFNFPFRIPHRLLPRQTTPRGLWGPCLGDPIFQEVPNDSAFAGPWNTLMKKSDTPLPGLLWEPCLGDPIFQELPNDSAFAGPWHRLMKKSDGRLAFCCCCCWNCCQVARLRRAISFL